MAVNKVVFGDQTIMDISDSTVNANNLLSGVKAYGANGEAVTGAVVTAEVVDNLTTQDANKALSAKQGYVLDQKKIDKTASEIITNTTSQFNTVTGGILQSCNVKLDINQDLHGYSKPWVGGSGKNKLPLTVSGIKSANTSGTWSGNTYTLNTEVFKINTDTDGNVTSIDVTHVSSGATLTLPLTLKTGTYHMSSGFSEDNGLNDTYLVANGTTIARGNTNSPGQVFTLSEETNATWNLRVYNKSFTAYPMICLNSETDKSFEPYSNVCPIEGHPSVEIDVCGINIFSPLSYETVDLNGQGTYRYGHEYPTGTYTIINKSAQQISYRLPKADLSDRGTTVNIDANGSATVTVDSTHVLWVFMFTWSSSVAEKICVRKDNDTTFVEFNGTDYTIPLGQTVYGCKFNAISGKLTIDEVCNTFDGSNDETIEVVAGTAFNRISCAISSDSITNSSSTEKTNKLWSDKYEEITDAMSNAGTIGVYYRANGSHKAMISAGDVGITDVASARTWLSNNPVQICYVLATPIIIQLTPQQIETLIGQNNISVPLEGQSLDSLTYRELFAWDDVQNTFADKVYNKDYLKSKNLIGLGTQLNGFVSGGNQFTPDSSAIGFVFSTSDLPDKITFNAVNGNRAYYAYFNTYPQNGTTCESKDQTSQTLPRTITVNKQYTYIHIQFSYGTTNLSNIQVEEGSEATVYTPYIKSNVELNTSGNFFGTCTTAGSTAAKVVTLSDATGFELKPGVIVGVKFSYTNTVGNVTLNVNNTGNKSIYFDTYVMTNSWPSVCGLSNRTNYYMYDGTYWVFLNNGGNNTPNVGTVTSVATGTGLTGGPITASGTISTYLARVTKDANTLPGANRILWEEFDGLSPNLPTAGWYHIITMEGTDTNYATQLALGMTANDAYYRMKNSEGWLQWRSIIDTHPSNMSQSEATAGTSTNARSISAKVLNDTIDAKTGKWLEQTATLSTSADTTYTFTDSDITASSMVDAWCEIDGFDYSSMTVAAGSVTVVYPKYTSAVSMKCRINVKNITI